MTNLICDLPELKALGNIESCRVIDGGLESRNFLLVINSVKYVFKLFKRTTIDEIGYELSILNELKNGFDCFPIPVTGVVYVGDVPGVLYTFLSGRSLEHADINTESIKRIANLQARMHMRLANFNPAGKRERFSIFDLSFFEEFKCEYSHDQEKEINLGRTFLEEKLKLFDPRDFTKSIIHEDLEMENVFIDVDGSVKFIDFGESHRAEVISDIATAVKELIVNTKGLDLLLIRFYLEEYNNVYSVIDKKQLAIFYTLLIRRTLFMLLYFLHKQSKDKNGLLENRIIKEENALRLLMSSDLTSVFTKFD